jgi:hypothetical protein
MSSLGVRGQSSASVSVRHLPLNGGMFEVTRFTRVQGRQVPVTTKVEEIALRRIGDQDINELLDRAKSDPWRTHTMQRGFGKQ